MSAVHYLEESGCDEGSCGLSVSSSRLSQREKQEEEKRDEGAHRSPPLPFVRLLRRLKNRTLRGPGTIRLGDEENGHGLDGDLTDDDLSEEEGEVRSPGGGGERLVSSGLSLLSFLRSLPPPTSPPLTSFADI